MRLALTVERHLACDRLTRFAHRFMGSLVDLLALDRLSEAHNEHVVAPTALAVHDDRDAVRPKLADELCPGELTALVGVDDLGHAVPGNRLIEHLHAEVRGERIREPLRQDAARYQLRDGDEVDEPRANRRVGDIERTDFIRSLDSEIAQ